MRIEHIEIKYERCACSGRANLEGIYHVKSLPWLSVVQSMEGSYDIAINGGKTYQTDAGGFFIAASQVTQHITHHNDPTTGRMSNRWIFLDVTVNQKYRLEQLYDFPTLLPSGEAEEMSRLFDALFADYDDPCERMSLYYKIVKCLLRVATPREEIADSGLLRVIDYLHTNYAKPISVAELAAVAHLSESYFYSCFKKQFGISPIAYLNHYRLTVASDLLKESDLPITRISEAVGFSDALYFSRLFRKTFRLSPRSYRQSVTY